MRKATEIKELPVLSIQDGINIKKVNRLAINPETRKVDYLCFDGTLWYEAPWVTPWSKLRAVGRDMITIKSKKDLVQVTDELRKALARTVEVIGSEVMDSSGKFGGKVADVVIDEATGDLRKIILEDGSTLDNSAIVTIGAAIVITETGDDSQSAAFSEHEFLLGKTVATDILDEKGNVIIPAGTIISGKDIEAAKAENALYDLVTGVK
jgi:sporulation protein YlmC with PRC-barrel domain